MSLEVGPGRGWPGQQLVNGYAVQLGQTLQAENRNNPLASLVRPEHRRLEFSSGGLLDS
jgi:hypothetical protein